MNRHQRRRQAAMDRHNAFFERYVRHLSPVAPEAPGVHHMVMHHDRQCTIYDGKGCSCDPDVRLFAEPARS